MLLYELFDNYNLDESSKVVWAKSDKGMTQKYRCTSGPKQGRLVNNPSDCGAPLDLKKQQKMRMTKKAKGKKMAKKAKRTKRVNPISTKVQKINKSMREK